MLLCGEICLETIPFLEWDMVILQKLDYTSFLHMLCQI